MIKIGILTYHASINNGAFLQAYALQRYLAERYAEKAKVEIINYNSSKAYLDYARQYCVGGRAEELWKKFRESRVFLELSPEELITDDIEILSEYIEKQGYDIIIAGSDEIWKTDGIRGFPNAYWLNTDLRGIIRIAYAVSGRNSYGLMTIKEKAYIKEAVEKFDYVGTRDEVTKNELLNIVQKKIYRNCDPTILGVHFFKKSKAEKEFIKKRLGLEKGKKIITLLITDIKLVERLYRLFHNENIVLAPYGFPGTGSDKDVYVQNPFEWSDMISISDLVITHLFHGTVFSMIHYIPFLSLEPAEKGRGKIEAILREYKMDRFMFYLDDYENQQRRMAMDIYTRAKKILWEELEKTLYDTLLLNEREKAASYIDYMDKCVDKMSN